MQEYILRHFLIDRDSRTPVTILIYIFRFWTSEIVEEIFHFR